MNDWTQEFFRNLGFPFDRLNDGRNWLETAPPKVVIDAVDGNFLSIDLDTLLDVDPVLMSALKTAQCKMIRQERASAYDVAGLTPQQMMNSWIDGSPTAEDLEAIRTPIKARFPWPGSYR